MVKTVTRTFIGIESSIIKMEMLNRMSEVVQRQEAELQAEAQGHREEGPTSLLTSFSNIRMINGNGWK